MKEQENVACFVAHKNITPARNWSDQIKKALGSMDIFLALITNDFNEGEFTQQETGYAIVKNIPRLFVKLETSDPMGFAHEEQATTANWKDSTEKIIGRLREDKLI